MKGAPILFAAAVIGGWAAGRTYVLWPRGVASHVPALMAGAPAQLPVASIGVGMVGDDLGLAGDPPQQGEDARPDTAAGTVTRFVRDPMAPQSRTGGRTDDLTPVTRVADSAGKRADMIPATTSGTDDANALALHERGEVLPVATINQRSTSRLHSDAWVIVRHGDGGDNLAFGQLGASQAGARLTYMVDPAHRFALSARLSAPLKGRGREGAAGLDWQPGRFPVHLLVEARVPLDGGVARPAIQLIGGLTETGPLGLRLETYGQAGAVHRRGGFADGSMRLTRHLLSHFDIGVGAWAAAQRRVSRVDTGPTVGLSLPVSSVTMRAAVDYRWRIAGNARPGSGPAVSLGTSF